MRSKQNQKKAFSIHALAMLILITILASSCAPASPVPTLTQTQSPQPPENWSRSTVTPTLRPSPTPTLPPLGSEGNPITIGFILRPDQTAAIEATEDIAFLIAQDTGFFIEYLIYPDFQSLATAILNGDVNFFWLEPLQYLYLNQIDAAEALLVTNHLGVYAYGIQFMANSQRGFRPFFNPENNESSADAEVALQQLSGTRPCYIAPESMPGYFVPKGFLENFQIPTLEPVFTYSYTAIIRALYIQGICDFGVSYALIGDARTASDVLQTLPDAQSRVQILWQSSGIIPNTNLSASTELPLNLQYRMQEAFLDLPNTAEGLSLLSLALDYDVKDLKAIDDGFYQPLRSLIAPLEIDLELLLLEKPSQ